MPYGACLARSRTPVGRSRKGKWGQVWNLAHLDWKYDFPGLPPFRLACGDVVDGTGELDAKGPCLAGARARAAKRERMSRHTWRSMRRTARRGQGSRMWTHMESTRVRMRNVWECGRVRTSPWRSSRLKRCPILKEDCVIPAKACPRGERGARSAERESTIDAGFWAPAFARATEVREVQPAVALSGRHYDQAQCRSIMSRGRIAFGRHPRPALSRGEDVGPLQLVRPVGPTPRS